MSDLVIVESPTKANTIKNYLGSGFRVVASKGHVRDLPKSALGVNIENSFEPKYINIRGKAPLINELKKEAKAAKTIYLATDPDREGEAISWHLSRVLGDANEEKIKRISFNEITKKAVREAIRHPGEIDMNLVNSQQARRILDRIVGYKLSPLLWEKIRNGLSAGRVQSVATRIIVEREDEINAFQSEEYWTIDGEFTADGTKSFRAKFFGKGAKKTALKNKEEADQILTALGGASYRIRSLKKGEKTRAPAPPFTTSSLQQEANRRLNFQSQKTMKVAQELYEGISLGKKGDHGLITYMRTDSVRVSDEAAEAARDYIVAQYQESYYPQTRRVFKSKSNTQDAHEAVRPSDVNLTPDSLKGHLSADQMKLYTLIWRRFIASQMASAVYDTVALEIGAATEADGEYLFKVSGETVRFPGFLALYEEKEDEEKEDGEKLPPLSESDPLRLIALFPKQNFTQPPTRYTEATLIKALEEKGIGRPSTYTPTITTILTRRYIERMGKYLKPTELGAVTTALMREHFASIVDYQFTADMEQRFDRIENGNSDYIKVLDEFYGEFAKQLEKAQETVEKLDVKVGEEELDILCEKCGANMVVKKGRYGRFAACPNYPECKNTKPIDRDGKLVEKKPEETVPGMQCELCGSEVVIRKGRYGDFYACKRYPECTFTKQQVTGIGVKCPKCGGQVVLKRGKKRTFYGCDNYPACDFSAWYPPTGELCGVCGGTLVKKKENEGAVCANKDCPTNQKEKK